MSKEVELLMDEIIEKRKKERPESPERLVRMIAEDKARDRYFEIKELILGMFYYTNKYEDPEAHRKACERWTAAMNTASEKEKIVMQMMFNEWTSLKRKS